MRSQLACLTKYTQTSRMEKILSKGCAYYFLTIFCRARTKLGIRSERAAGKIVLPDNTALQNREIHYVLFRLKFLKFSNLAILLTRTWAFSVLKVEQDELLLSEDKLAELCHFLHYSEECTLSLADWLFVRDREDNSLRMFANTLIL